MTYATPWLKYWVVMGIEQALENTFGVVLSVLPLYSLARLVFFAWLVLPQSQGAVKLYDEKVEPFLDRYNTQIEDFFANGHTYLREYGLEYISVLVKWLTGKGFDSKSATGTPQSASAAPVPTPQTYMDSFYDYLKTGPAAGGKITRLFDMYRAAGAAGVVGGAGSSRDISISDIPTSLPHSEQLGLIEKERTRLLAAISSLDARGSLLKSDTRSTSSLRSDVISIASGINIASDYSPSLGPYSGGSDTEFDVVKQEDVLGLDAKDQKDANPKGWFWQRPYARVDDTDKGDKDAPAPAPSRSAEEEPLIAD